MIPRQIQALIEARLFQGKAILIVGPRQVGKTTLLRQLFAGDDRVRWLNGDDPETLQLLEQITLARWKQLIGRNQILVLDEAQRVSNIGIKLKLLTDQLPEIQVIASGSSAFELANQLNEPLTGRKWAYQMFPLSYREMVEHTGWWEEKQQLAQRLVFGYYPEVVNHPLDAREVLQQLADSYLFKDILRWGQIKKSDKLIQLLQALAFQLGNEVSYLELANTVGIASETVESYIQLLEKSFIIFRLPPLSRNLRKELKTKRKIYFYDNGIRNAIIAQFQPVELRNDIGALWENWLISERKKVLAYQRIPANSFFWRTQDQQEIDYIEERNGAFHAFEIKWNLKAKVRFSKTFLRAYPEHTTTILNRDHFETFLGVEK
ncbi:MAG: ATP-binding protein [Bacteroidota bacterium]